MNNTVISIFLSMMEFEHKSQTFTLSTFNCNGLRSSMAYVTELVSNHNINFVCEHWLKPSDLHSVKGCFSNKWCYFKSSMKTDEVALGRPYGGVGYICDLLPGVRYHVVECDSDRICCIRVIKNQKILLTLIGVYLPFDNHTVTQTELYIEVLDQIKCLIQDANDSGPTLIMGDMNTALPQQVALQDKWYCTRPFSKRSVMLYDLICDHDMFVANFTYKQDINYTYRKAGDKSYIDHLLIPQYCINMLEHCRILCNDYNNVSDHYAISCGITLPTSRSSGLMTSEKEQQKYHVSPKIPRYDFENRQFQELYADNVYVNMANIVPVNKDKLCEQSARQYVNKLSNQLSDGMHHAAKLTYDKIETYRNAKSRHRCHWWTKNCSVARNRSRLYFHIWKSSGRPTQGQVYQCYLDARRAY